MEQPGGERENKKVRERENKKVREREEKEREKMAVHNLTKTESRIERERSTANSQIHNVHSLSTQQLRQDQLLLVIEKR